MKQVMGYELQSGQKSMYQKEIRSFIYSSWQKMLCGWAWLWYESMRPDKDLEGPW